MADISSCAMIFYKTIGLSVGLQNVFDLVLWLTHFLIRHSIFSRYTTSETALKSTTSTTELLLELAHQQGEYFLTIG
jgi:hypothetical protein